MEPSANFFKTTEYNIYSTEKSPLRHLKKPWFILREIWFFFSLKEKYLFFLNNYNILVSKLINIKTKKKNPSRLLLLILHTQRYKTWHTVILAEKNKFTADIRLSLVTILLSALVTREIIVGKSWIFFFYPFVAGINLKFFGGFFVWHKTANGLSGLSDLYKCS